MIIVILEGVDGTGKTTRAMELVDELKSKGIKAEYIKFPYDYYLQNYIRNPDVDLTNEELQKVMLSDFIMTGFLIKETAVENNLDVLVVDRFTPISSMVYYREMPFQYEALNIFDKLLDHPYYL